jgi:predicted dehydrogenase
MNRRQFIFDLGATTAGLAVAGCATTTQPRRPSANEKLNIGIIGVAGQGGFSIDNLTSQNLVALCDIDDNNLAAAAKRFPSAKTYHDFRRLIDQPDLDAIVVATPDHTHAVATVAVLKSGRHVYCEKPLTRTLSECRIVTDLARTSGLATQIGTQIHAGNNYRRVVELVQAKAVGEIKEVHVWVSATYGGKKWPTEFPPVPAHIHYDLWLGPVQRVPYSPEWVPFKWRNWWHFSGGALGDFGCHYMDLPFWALGLKYPLSAEAEGPELDAHYPPPSLTVRYVFPPLRSEAKPLPLTWYHGGKKPSQDILHPELAAKWGSGVMFVGEKGMLLADYSRHLLLPEDRFRDFTPPAPTIPNSAGHHNEWVQACKFGTPTTCAFEYSGPLTETALLGNVAYRVGKKIEWDAARLRAKNSPEATQYIQHKYRSGWSI